MRRVEFGGLPLEIVRGRDVRVWAAERPVQAQCRLVVADLAGQQDGGSDPVDDGGDFPDVRVHLVLVTALDGRSGELLDVPERDGHRALMRRGGGIGPGAGPLAVVYGQGGKGPEDTKNHEPAPLPQGRRCPQRSPANPVRIEVGAVGGLPVDSGGHGGAKS